MKWFIGVSGTSDDFTKYPEFEEADVVYLYFLQAIEHLQSLKKFSHTGKTLVIFTENVLGEPKIYESIFRLFAELKEWWKGDVICQGPSDEVQRYVVEKAMKNGNRYIAVWVSLPQSQIHYKQGITGRWGDFYILWAYNEYKGLNEAKFVSDFVPIKIMDYSNCNPATWCEQLLEARGVMWAARAESIGKTIVSAGAAGKPLIMYRSTNWDYVPQAFNNYEIFGKSNLFYKCALVCYSLEEWTAAAQRLLKDDEEAQLRGENLKRFFKIYEEFWVWDILYERFKDEVGLVLPKDMTPCHHLLPTFFTADMFDDEKNFPRGEWSNNPLSLNWRCR